MVDLDKYLEQCNGQVLDTSIGSVVFWRPDTDSLYIDSSTLYSAEFAPELINIIENIALAEGRNTLYTSIHMCIIGAEKLHETLAEAGLSLYLPSEIINVYRKKIDG